MQREDNVGLERKIGSKYRFSSQNFIPSYEVRKDMGGYARKLRITDGRSAVACKIETKLPLHSLWTCRAKRTPTFPGFPNRPKQSLNYTD